MPYANQADLEARYPLTELKQLYGAPGGVLDAARVAVGLADASSEMDTYIGRRFVLPVAGTDDLRRVCCDIAAYRAQTLRHEDDIKDARKRYDDALKFLNCLVEGDLDLPGATLRADIASPAGLASPGPAMFAAPVPSDWARGSY
jgi:phage gp36-like protein